MNRYNKSYPHLQACIFVSCVSYRPFLRKKSIFTSGPENGVIFAFLRKFSAFFFLLLHFLFRLLFIIVQMLTFKRKLFWGLEYPFNGISKGYKQTLRFLIFVEGFLLVNYILLHHTFDIKR